MAVIFFKRFRMQVDLRSLQMDVRETPLDYTIHRWNQGLLSAHGEAKYFSFRDELDTVVFPCLGDASGCLRLMREISCRRDFLPEATWLATFHDPVSGRLENCGTIQGIRENLDVGSIQNVGIVSDHRGVGLGSLIVQQSLRGFKTAGIKIVTLEVTAKNTGAIRLYERLGFRIVRTVYKSNEVADV